MRTLRNLAGIALLSLGLIGGVAAPAAHAASKPDCMGSACNGKNPSGTSCASDAKSVWKHQVTTYGEMYDDQIQYLVEIRYSPSCLASWTRITGDVKYGISDDLYEDAWIPAEIWTRVDPSLPIPATKPKGWSAEKKVSRKKKSHFQFWTPMATDTGIDQVSACYWESTGRHCSGYRHL
ncbi:MAG: DUF2690 domain-containing protein [Kineosporiaceae bacterium]